ncbi:MAG: response regulator transcription factor [Lachnospiraceae bacterium]|nr:response regulator transcription factor [Lachnospiraceae bacterium]
MRLRVAICDDELIISEEAKRCIAEIRPEYVVDIYQSGYELLEKESEYDIFLLDIEMPDIDGMEIAKRLHEKKTDKYIIFFTNYMGYIQNAFQVRAFRYFEKPVCKQKLLEAFQMIEREFLENIKIPVLVKEATYFVNINDIVFIASLGDGTYIYTKTGEIFENSKTLKYWKDFLKNKYFCQVHKSYIVSMRYISALKEKEVELSNIKIKIPLSRRRKNECKDALFQYIREKIR